MLESQVAQYNLGRSLIGRFEHSGMVADLDNAISTFKEAVHLTPDVHADNPNFYRTLGHCFVLQFKTLKKVDDSSTAIWHFSQAVKLTTGSSIRFDTAVEWAHFASTINHSSVLEAYTAALNLLPRVVWLGQTITRRHRKIKSIGDITNEAAAAAISAEQYDTALEWLEWSRSIVWGATASPSYTSRALHNEEPALAENQTGVKALE